MIEDNMQKPVEENVVINRRDNAQFGIIEMKLKEFKSQWNNGKRNLTVNFETVEKIANGISSNDWSGHSKEKTTRELQHFAKLCTDYAVQLKTVEGFVDDVITKYVEAEKKTKDNIEVNKTHNAVISSSNEYTIPKYDEIKLVERVPVIISNSNKETNI